MNKFWKKVTQHSIAAGARWSFMVDKRVLKALWNQVLTEEVGKLNRACNKLALATDPQVRAEWEREGLHRLVTIASICQRFHDNFGDLPDAPEAYSCRPEAVTE